MPLEYLEITRRAPSAGPVSKVSDLISVRVSARGVIKQDRSDYRRCWSAPAPPRCHICAKLLAAHASSHGATLLLYGWQQRVVGSPRAARHITPTTIAGCNAYP